MTKPYAIAAVNAALLVMDYQHGILDNTLCADQARAALCATAQMLAAARETGTQVIYVTLSFRPGYPEVSPNNRVFSGMKAEGRFMQGAADTAIHPTVAPKDGEPVVIKHRYGAFSETDLNTLLRAKGINTLVLCGISTSGVVLSTLRQAADLDYRIVVAREGCADSDPEVHRVLLDKILVKHAEVRSVPDIAAALHAA
ncbi:cysteine hydrolase family protein [Bordetella avium]|uniref:Isochorismatase-family hydrolase n=1 Tax=Bordetella avium (strain 197N) TaxID=360910 RepID=Q2KX37_BORA1|nr:isochorismatase family cysteine hydrolase [Bordetella avium]RIQ49016.1 cysteine hydrolase [Bordetella avium]RIQ75026.1 cysteine hydrolase [Bordetella avium]CAJ48325.1 isochorismatase-family hydrolase [Bordetella avium 197N]